MPARSSSDTAALVATSPARKTYADEGSDSAELERAAAGERERDRSERQARGDAQAEREHVDLAERAVRVAEEPGDLGHALARADDAHAVAELEQHLRIGDEVDVAAPHPRDRCLVAFVEIEVREPPACDAPARDDDPPEVELAPVELDPVAGLVAELRDDLLDVYRPADDGQDVAGLRRDLVRGHGQGAAVPDPAEGDGRRVTLPQLPQSRDRTLDDDAPGDDRLQLRPPPLQHHLDGEQRQQHAQRVAQR